MTIRIEKIRIEKLILTNHNKHHFVKAIEDTENEGWELITVSQNGDRVFTLFFRKVNQWKHK